SLDRGDRAAVHRAAPQAQGGLKLQGDRGAPAPSLPGRGAVAGRALRGSHWAHVARGRVALVVRLDGADDSSRSRVHSQDATASGGILTVHATTRAIVGAI